MPDHGTCEIQKMEDASDDCYKVVLASTGTYLDGSLAFLSGSSIYSPGFLLSHS